MKLLWFLMGCQDTLDHPEGIVIIAQEQQVSWQRIFNPLLINGSTRWPTNTGIYEPLLIYNPMEGKYVPWLATDYEFNDTATELQLNIRKGVRWSDGEALTPEDVAYSFEILKQYPALDPQGLWSTLERIELEGSIVRFIFAEPCFSGLDRIAHQVIIPKHIWKDIEDPINFTNPNPIASGPFTEITHFSSQSWQLEKNPYYWQELGIQGLQFPALPSNEQANLALLQGEIDWAGNFVPAIERIYVARDPENHHFWFPLVGSSVLLYPNHLKAPFHDLEVRKALSYAIDRELLAQVALHNYTAPANESGLSSAYDYWQMPAWETREKWTSYNPEKALQLLKQEGWTKNNDGFLEKDGEVFQVEISVVSGWSDWVRAAQVIARSFQKIGIDASVSNQDFGSWFQDLQQGQFQLSLGWSQDGPHPIGFYQSMLSESSVQPIGETASINWHRYSHSGSDQLISHFESTANPEIQLQIAQELQEIFVNQVPAIPLFLNPSWGEYNSSRFDGFPSKENPYARLSPNHSPEPLLVLTKLRQK